jgi:hypothetical protein
MIKRFVLAAPGLLAALLLGCSSDDPVVNAGTGGSGGSAASGSGGTSSGGSSGSGGLAGGGAGGGGGLGALGGLGGLDGGGAGGGGGSIQPTTPVDVLITADNAYGFGYGTGDRLVNYFGGIENPGTGDIFDCPIGNGPESYTVPTESANAGSYLYIIGYADKSTTQGVIAKFSREGAQPVFTGHGEWQVCATGEDYDVGSGGPSRAAIDAQIVNCNAGTGDAGTTSGGWVTTTPGPNGSVAFGEDNSTTRGNPEPGNEFLIACEIDPQARWMWFDWDPNADQSPFIWPGGGENIDKEFLIFRLGAEFIPPPPPQ